MRKPLIVLVIVLALVGGYIAVLQITQTPVPGQSDTQHVSDAAWDDYTLFREGLVSSEQAATDHLSDATVYHIDLTISEGFLLLKGHEEVRYTNRENEPLNEIYFRLFPNIMGGESTVSAVKVNDKDVKPSYQHENSALRVLLPQALKPGEQAIIKMDFTVEVAQDAKDSEGLFGYFDRVLVLDNCYPVIPVYDDEKWNLEIPPPYGDSTSLDASFYLVRVTAPVDVKVVASGITTSREFQGDDQVLAFAVGPARDFYLAASESYSVVTDKVGETTINSYALSGQKEGAKVALQVAKDALESFNNRFGIYPYTELDIVSTPLEVDGMEYPGVVAISEELYDLDVVTEGESSRDVLEGTVAHEVGHQWFYNVIGNDQVDEPWLDEAVTEYVTMLYYTDVHGEAAAQEYREWWYELWDLTNREDIPIGLPSYEYTSDEEYTSIVYGRGALFIEALAETMGQHSFDTFLHDYYETYKWGISTSEGFKQLAEEHCQCDLTDLFEEWVGESTTHFFLFST